MIEALTAERQRKDRDLDKVLGELAFLAALKAVEEANSFTGETI